MKIERIALRGFLSHSKTDWQPNGARLATLVGPNGAGKSSLLDAVLYCLYDAARARTDDLVQLGSSDMSATVEFSYAGARYRVTRGRSTRAGGKSYLELHVRDSDAWRPLTGDSIRETQAAIEQLLRMDAATFQTAAFLVQGRANAFAEASAAERKRILSTVLGLDVYAAAEARAREAATEVGVALAGCAGEIEHLDAQLADRGRHQAAVDHYGHQLEEHETHGLQLQAKLDEQRRILHDTDGKLAAAAAAEERVQQLTEEVGRWVERWQTSEARRKRAAVREAELRAIASDLPELRRHAERRAELDEQLREAEKLEFRNRGAETAIADARRAVVAAEAEQERASAVHQAKGESLREQLATLQAMEGERIACPECGADIPAGGEALLNRIRAVEEQLGAWLAAASPAVGAPAELADALEKAIADHAALGYDAQAHDALRREFRDLEGVPARFAAASNADEQIEAATTEVLEAFNAAREAEASGRQARSQLDEAKAKGGDTAALRKERIRIQTEIADLERRQRFNAGEQRQAAESLATARARVEALDQAQHRRDELTAQQDSWRAEAALLKRLVTAFGVNGIPARIIESVLPELSRHANELLAQLRPGMALDIRAQRAKKSGAGVVEALDLVVRDDVGERPLSLFSGGERMSVSLALAVGLSRLVARRAGTAIRSLVIDEPDGLDAEARRSFGQALRILAHAGELERVILVSHHPDLADVGDAVYQVTRNGRGSVVAEVA